MHPVLFYGDYSVVACTLVCETGSTGSIPVSHPNSSLAQLVEQHLDTVKVTSSTLVGTTKFRDTHSKTIINDR